MYFTNVAYADKDSSKWHLWMLNIFDCLYALFVIIWYIRGSRFLIYNFLQFATDGKNNSKTKLEKVVLFIFMSSYEEMSVLK
jgi:hypothetical protein